MKVAELFLVEETLKDYSDRLVKTLNVKRLGSGAYAHVFQHPAFSNVVVKVFTARDKTYKRYLAWCLKHQNNKYVPKIIEAVPFKSDTGDAYTIVFMQKMTKVSESKFGDWLESMFGEKIAAIYHDDEDWSKLYAAIHKASAKIKDADFKEIWDHVLSYGEHRLDLHAGNIMMRGNQVVFSDPVGDDPGDHRIDSQ